MSVNLKTKEGFTKWYDQKSKNNRFAAWGSDKPGFGKKKETEGKILNYEEFMTIVKRDA